MRTRSPVDGAAVAARPAVAARKPLKKRISRHHTNSRKKPMNQSLYHRILCSLGSEVGAKTLAALAGQRIYIPQKARLAKDHTLRRFLGSRTAEKICEQFSGEALDFPARPEPTPAKNTAQRCIALKDKGCRLNDIAQICGISRRRVLQILAQNRKQASPTSTLPTPRPKNTLANNFNNAPNG